MIEMINSSLDIVVIIIGIILAGYLAILLIQIEIEQARSTNRFIEYLQKRIDEEKKQ